MLCKTAIVNIVSSHFKTDPITQVKTQLQLNSKCVNVKKLSKCSRDSLNFKIKGVRAKNKFAYRNS